MADKHAKDEAIGEVGVIEDVQVEETVIETKLAPTKELFFFPPDFSCEAESREEAEKLYEQHMKGAHSPA